MSALILSILLTIAGLGLFIFTWGLHPFAWEPTLHPLLGWILCGLGVLIPGISFWWLVIEEEEWEVWGISAVVGLLVFLVGWYLEFLLLLFPYLLGGLLYLASFILVGLGVREAWWEWQAWRVLNKWRHGASDSFDPFDDADNSSHERQHEQRADDPQDEAVDPFKWARSVLGITPDATKQRNS